jgi:diadenylate cyclase
LHDLLSAILSALGRFTWSSALDIAIVTVVLYGVLMLIRGTRADQVLRGVIVIMIFFSIMAQAFHLTMVDWLVRNSPVVLLVAIPIIFQPELRRALEQVGRTSAIINPRLTTTLQGTAVDQIVDAVRRLAERHFGALIVLEGETGLEDFVRNAERIDAEVTTKLLETIFFIHTPLHDGAVIIRGDRLLAAGCVLPLSDNPSALGRGTRHRAALGITEQTDAACIVVSEETGTVSLARGGHLTTDISFERLSRFLNAFYRSHTGPIPLVPVVGSR